MISIFAHRALYNNLEHSELGIKYYLDNHFNIEIDLRINSGGVYLSHDRTHKAISLESICPLLKNSQVVIALHVKELECVTSTIKLLNTYGIKNCFLFDTDYNLVKNMSQNFEVADHINSNPSQITSKILWCDEIQEKWYSSKRINDLHKQGKIIYAVSCELVKSSTFEQIVQDWKKLIDVGIDGICTNYPLELHKFMAKKIKT